MSDSGANSEGFRINLIFSLLSFSEVAKLFEMSTVLSEDLAAAVEVEAAADEEALVAAMYEEEVEWD